MGKPQNQLIATDAQSFEAQEQTATLLEMLSLGNQHLTGPPTASQ